MRANVCEMSCEIVQPCMQVVEPNNKTFAKYIDHLERDPEREVYNLLVSLRCAPFLDSYVATLESDHRMGKNVSMPLGLRTHDSIGGRTGTFHHINNGIDFRSGVLVHASL